MKIKSNYYLNSFNKENEIFKINNGLITIILASLIILFINFLFYTPFIHGYDEMAKWSAAKEFIKNFYISNQHHSMRWGAWITALVFQGFENGPLAYYIHNLLVLQISLIIFSYIIFKYSGIIPSIIFLLITHFNDFILWSGFQADVTIATFLPLSLIILCVQKNILNKTLNFTLFVFLCFYLYGVKETNLYFIPGILLFLFRYYGIKKCANFILFYVLFYILETFFFKYYSNNFSSYGRIFELFSGAANNETKEYFLINFPNLKLLDIIILRWNFLPSTPIYLITLLGVIYICCINYKKKIAKQKTEVFISLITLSFFFFNTFIISSIDPLLPIQAFVYRYNVVIYPICTGFISILIYKIFLLKKNKLLKITSLLIFIYLLAPTIKFLITEHPYNYSNHTQKKLKINDLVYDSFFSRMKYYNKLKKLISNEDYCFASINDPKLSAVPFILGFYPYYTQHKFYLNDKWIHSYKIKECENIFDIDNMSRESK